MPSREVQSIIGYVKAAGIPYRVTDIATPGVHSTTSYHYAPGTGGQGLAVDFAGTAPGTSAAMVAQMSAIWRAFRPVAPKLAELFFQSPEILMVIKNGVWRPGLATLGAAGWAAHRNHVHVAVRQGTFLVPPATSVPAAGSGPPTVRRTEYPGGEDMLTRHDIDIPSLDGQGRGWVELDVPAATVVSIVANGPYPPVDGYWELPVVARQDRGGKTVVSITEGQPNGRVLLSVWSLS